jgi:hypothetical protein
MTGRAVVNAIRHELQGEHETVRGRRYAVPLEEVERIIEDWPDAPKNIAHQMLEKYGPPNEATPTQLFWHGNRPWKRTILNSDIVTHNWPTVHSDFLTQTIDYRVPVEKIGEVVEFDGSVVVDRTRGEVSARCDAEAANVLAMNMVHEIATGQRTVQQARKVSEESTVAYNLGRNAPYAERIRFEVPEGGTEDLDTSAVSGPIARQTAGKVKDVLTGFEEEPVERRTGPERG